TDPYLRERGQDVRSLRRLLLLSLLGTLTDAPPTSEPSVLVVDELDAATASTLDPATTLGVVTTTGGATGHGVIVATSRGIPVLTGSPGAAALHDGDAVAFDPLTRQLWVDPTPEEILDLQQRATMRDAASTEASAHASEPARTRDGRRVVVEANIASLADATVGRASGAEGSGLVRTELLFGHLATAPTPQEQADVFVAIGEALGGEPITIRTWDVGGDKPLPFLAQSAEANPFLGERGLRTMRRVPDLFADQLRAIVLASTRTPVRVLFPMVTEPQEVEWARGILASVLHELDADPIPVGIMIEVPAAAVRAADFAPLIDFASIGTNDLTQYTTATDRGNGLVAHLARADSPAVLDLIRATCTALAPRPIAVCGDLASDTTMTATLVGLGVTELSVRAPLVGLVKQAVRER
ncbi:MAG TPA: putative PEP-binding protein, partial [Propionibacteriaceae bacterium]|nr:putative PEP-binding protein [Propionibacteriaceae bacterium]